MLKTLYPINTLRWMVFFVSVLGFGCHLGQYILLIQYQEKAVIPSWVQAGHWQYLTWWVVLGLSLASSCAVVMHAFCFKRAEFMRGDKILAVFNILPLLTSIFTAILFVTNEPWSNGVVEIRRPSVTDLITFCQHLDSPIVDHYHPLLYQRCLLSDATWIGVALTCLFWTCLFVVALCTRRPDESEKSGETYRVQLKEPHWGRYMPEPVVDHHDMMLQQHPDIKAYHQHSPSKLLHTSSVSYPSSPYSYQKQPQCPDSSYYYHQQTPQSEKVELCDTEADAYAHYNGSSQYH